MYHPPDTTALLNLGSRGFFCANSRICHACQQPQRCGYVRARGKSPSCICNCGFAVNYSNHFKFGIACWVATATLVETAANPGNIVVAGFAALLPDLDHPHSILGRRVPFVPWLLTRFSQHRGVTHSLLSLVVIGAGLYWLVGQYPGLRADVLLALFIGYASGILGDIFTTGGVQFWWPSKRWLRLPFCWKSGSSFETFFTYIVLLVAAYYWTMQRSIHLDFMQWWESFSSFYLRFF